jgi:hypothetical protein
MAPPRTEREQMAMKVKGQFDQRPVQQQRRIR